MRILKEGDKSLALCESCGRRTTTTYKYRSIELEESRVEVDNVLVGVCDECGAIASIPAQSFPRLKEARSGKEKIVEARVPLELDDVIRLISDHFDVPDTNFRASLFRYYLNLVVHDSGFAKRVERLSKKDLAQRIARARVSLRVREDLWSDSWSAARHAGINSWASLIKGIVIAAQEDVLSNRAPKRREALESIAAST
jgi:hypothetical protein